MPVDSCIFPVENNRGGRAQHKQQTVFFLNSFPLSFIAFLDLSIQPTFFGDLFGACVVRHAVLIWADILPYHPLSSFQARVSCPTPDMGIQAPWMMGQGVCDMLQVNGKVYLKNWPKFLLEVAGISGFLHGQFLLGGVAPSKVSWQLMATWDPAGWESLSGKKGQGILPKSPSGLGIYSSLARCMLWIPEGFLFLVRIKRRMQHTEIPKLSCMEGKISCWRSHDRNFL